MYHIHCNPDVSSPMSNGISYSSYRRKTCRNNIRMWLGNLDVLHAALSVGHEQD